MELWEGYQVLSHKLLPQMMFKHNIFIADNHQLVCEVESQANRRSRRGAVYDLAMFTYAVTVSQVCRKYKRTDGERLLLKLSIKTLLRSQMERESNCAFDFFILIPETKPHKIRPCLVKTSTLPRLKIKINCYLVYSNIDKFYISNNKRTSFMNRP